MIEVVKCDHAESGECVIGKGCNPFALGRVCPRAEKDAYLRYFNPANSVVLVWETDDVIQERNALTQLQAMEVLEAVQCDHDANYGVTWSTLRDTADNMFDQPTVGHYAKKEV